MKHLVIGQRLKTPNFSAFHWSPRGSLVSIGQHFVATKVVHLPKSTETSLITESAQSGPKHQLLQLCMASTAWSDSDQAVRAVHSCNSWFIPIMPPDLALWLTLISSNYPCLEHIFMVPKVLEPLKFYRIYQSKWFHSKGSSVPGERNDVDMLVHKGKLFIICRFRTDCCW